MSRYDGLIIPRSYSEYINKTDAATLQQALQLSGVLSGAVAAGDNKAVKSSAVYNALANYRKIKEYTVTFDIVGTRNIQGFKDFVLNNINDWENGDIITCKTNSGQTAKIEVDKVANNYFNLMYTTYYNTRPQYIRYLSGSWVFYEINVTQI